MKTICLMLALMAVTPAMAESVKSQPAAPAPSRDASRDIRQQDPYGAAAPVTHWDSLRKQLPASPKPGAEKPLGTG